MKGLPWILLLALLVPGSLRAEIPVRRLPADADPSTRDLRLIPLWRAGGPGDEEVLLGRVARIVQDEAGRAYVLDTQLSTVLVFSPKGDLLDEIGREGEGPGEFRRPVDMALLPGGRVAVLQMMPAKIALLRTDGTVLDDHPLSEEFHSGTRALNRIRARPGGGLVAASSTFLFSPEKAERRESLLSLDEQGRVTATFHDQSVEQDFAHLQVHETDMDTFARYWAVLDDGRVVLAPDQDAYRLQVFSEDGDLLEVIERAYPLHRRSEEEKAEAVSRYGMVINGKKAEILPAEVDRVVFRLIPRPHGGLWVLTGRGMEEPGEGVVARLDAYDADLRPTGTVALHGEADLDRDRLYFCGDDVYVLKGANLVWREDEDAGPEPEALTLIRCRLED